MREVGKSVPQALIKYGEQVRVWQANRRRKEDTNLQSCLAQTTPYNPPTDNTFHPPALAATVANLSRQGIEETNPGKQNVYVCFDAPASLAVCSREKPAVCSHHGKTYKTMFARIAPSLSRSEQKVARSELTVQRHAARSWDRSCLPEVFYRVNVVTQ